VDSLTLAQFFINCGTQYSGLALSQVPSLMNEQKNLQHVLLAPIRGFGTSYTYLRIAKDAAERGTRIAQIASFLSMSTTASTMDPATNIAAGASVGAFIEHMKEIIAKHSTGNSLFINVAILSKITTTDWIIIHVVLIGGVLVI
jgi:hypothetical protein